MAPSEKVTTTKLLQLKQKGEKIAAVTCYDWTFARIVEEAKADVVLVGDSLGMVMLGYENTLPVTVDEVLHHTKAVKRALTRPLLVADMPYLSYEVDAKEAVRNAGRLVKEGGAEAVKVEGGIEVAPVIKELVKTNIPVMGHLGLTPQAIHRLGGYKVQGRLPKDAEKMLTDAKVLEGAGVFAIVLEAVPSELAREITRKVSVPTIGIGAGPHTDGQILVLHDLLGLYGDSSPRFVKRYAELRKESLKALQAYCREVRETSFPRAEHEYVPAGPK